LKPEYENQLRVLAEKPPFGSLEYHDMYRGYMRALFAEIDELRNRQLTVAFDATPIPFVREEDTDAVAMLKRVHASLGRWLDADAAQHSSDQEEADTLAEWLHTRFRGRHVPHVYWNELGSVDKSLWEHEAKAVKRAALRGGFKR
jgi:hypothetical protein